MPWNCTLAIIRIAKSHDLSYDPAKNARRFRRGDICEAYLTNDVATIDGDGDYRMNGGISSLVYGFVHITDVPDVVTLAKLKEKLTASIADPLAAPELPMQLRRYAWKVKVSAIPTALQDKFLAEKEITVTFAAARTRIRRKSVVNRSLPDLDDDTYEVQDGDLQ